MNDPIPSASSLFSALMSGGAASTLAEGACGPDLEYAPHFLDFMASAQGKEEQQLGASIIAAQTPDWRAVLKAGIALSGETRDLRIAVILTHAATEIHGLRGLADGLALIAQWLSTYWETLHPALEAEGEPDPLMRANALSYLYAPTACLKSVRQARLLESRIGDLSVSEAEDIIKVRAIHNTAVVTTPEQLTNLIANEHERNAPAFAALREAAAHQQTIESLWKSRLDTEYWPAFEGLRDLLDRLAELLAAPFQDAAADTASQTSGAEPASTQDAHPPVRQNTLPNAVDSRRDAFQSLALARQYFERNEPSHPATLLIRRIETLEHLNFAELISELTPDGLGQLKQIAGQQLSI